MDMWSWMPPLLASFVRAILTLRLLKPDMCEIFTVRTHTCHIANREQSCSSLVLLVLNGWVWSSPAVPSHEPREKKIASSMQMLHLTTAMMKKTQTGGYQSLVTMASTEITQFFGAKMVTSSAKETLLQALPTSSQTCVASAASQRNHWRSLDPSLFPLFPLPFFTITLSDPGSGPLPGHELKWNQNTVSSRPRGSPGPLDIRQLLATRHALVWSDNVR